MIDLITRLQAAVEEAGKLQERLDRIEKANDGKDRKIVRQREEIKRLAQELEARPTQPPKVTDQMVKRRIEEDETKRINGYKAEAYDLHIKLGKMDLDSPDFEPSLKRLRDLAGHLEWERDYLERMISRDA